MARKCVYCSREMSDKSAIDVCDSCGKKVWGERMFNAIKQNMESARDKGNLDQGSVTAAAAPAAVNTVGDSLKTSVSGSGSTRDKGNLDQGSVTGF